MRKKSITPVIAAAAILLCAGTGCNKNEATNRYEAPAAVGSGGGVVEITDPENPLYGARVIIPQDALSKSTTISIEQRSVPAELPPDYMLAGPCVDFGPDGSIFNKQVDIMLPYHDRDSDGMIDGTAVAESLAGVFYYNESADAWEEVEIVEKNPNRNIIQARTMHFSTFLVPVSADPTDTSATGETGFLPGEYFVGKPRFSIDAAGKRDLVRLGCLNQNLTQCNQTVTCKRCGTPYVLTVRPQLTDLGTILVAAVDRFTCFDGGYPITISEDGQSATFYVTDNSSYFPFEKLKQSGSAELWEWQCDYVAEHAKLQNYMACEQGDSNALCEAAGEPITCGIEAAGTTVTIHFGIDLTDSVNSSGRPVPNAEAGISDMLPIAFEATYK